MLYYLYFIVRVIELSSLLQSVILVIINIFYVILTCVIVLLHWSNNILACYLLPVEAFQGKEFPPAVWRTFNSQTKLSFVCELNVFHTAGGSKVNFF